MTRRRPRPAPPLHALGGTARAGVFVYYNDKTFSNCLSTVLKLLLSVKLDALMAYREAADTYFQFVELLFYHHTQLFIAEVRASWPARATPDVLTVVRRAASADGPAHVCGFVRVAGGERGPLREEHQHTHVLRAGPHPLLAPAQRAQARPRSAIRSPRSVPSVTVR